MEQWAIERFIWDTKHIFYYSQQVRCGLFSMLCGLWNMLCGLETDRAIVQSIERKIERPSKRLGDRASDWAELNRALMYLQSHQARVEETLRMRVEETFQRILGGSY